MIPFIPKSVIYPAAGKHEVLVAGEVDGEIRNVTVTNEELAARYRVPELTTEARSAIDADAMKLAVEKYTQDNTPVE